MMRPYSRFRRFGGRGVGSALLLGALLLLPAGWLLAIGLGQATPAAAEVWCGTPGSPAATLTVAAVASEAGTDAIPNASTSGGASGGGTFFDGWGAYMPRTHCMVTAEGEPDWFWIGALVLLNVGVIAAYLRIYWFWIRSYYAEEKRDRNQRLLDLSQIFLWCAVCGYVASVVMFVWPGYRLVAVCLVLLNVWAWRFVMRLDGFAVAFSANRFRRLAHTDELTGLANRVAMLAAIEAANVQQRQRGDERLGFVVMYLDFDHFKQVNDTMGHEAGDALLKDIAGRLRQTLRAGDPCDAGLARGGSLAARVGGDEFVVLLSRIRDERTATLLADRLRAKFSEPFVIADQKVQTGASIGVAFVTGEQSADDVLRDADIAMYAAKSGGRDKVAVFDHRMHAEVSRRQAITNELTHAIANGELWLEYQPIVELESGRVMGFEALMRWENATLGQVHPAEFIAIAEESSRLIEAIGGFALDRAASDLAGWRKAHPELPELFVNINVSRRQLESPQLVGFVDGLLQRYDLPASTVHLEITERFVAGGEAAMIERLQALSALGIKIDLDDFGTGLSAMHCLSSLPLDVVKIDGCFVNDQANRYEAMAIVQAIVILAQNLGMEVIAERIETAESLVEMQAMGCCLGQGYFFSRPVKPAAVEAMLRRPYLATGRIAASA